MGTLKSKLEEYEKALREKDSLTKALKDLELTIELRKGYELVGNATFFDHTGSYKSVLSLQYILPARQLVELIKVRIDSLSEFIEKTEPVLKMAEMAFKGMEKHHECF